MSEDLISRQWLMECVNEGWIKFDTEKDENRFIHLVRDIAPSAQPEYTIEMQESDIDEAMKLVRDARPTILPPAQPERVRGRWDDEGWYADGHNAHAYRCTQCGYHMIEYPDSLEEWHFCPNCGADMMGKEQHETD